MRDYGSDHTRILSIYDMVHLDEDRMFWGRDWWHEVLGQEVVGFKSPAEGEPDPRAFGPEELVESLKVLCDLADSAVDSAERRVKGGGEKELPFLAMDAKCMTLLGRFWISRVEAAKALIKDDKDSALTHMSKALDHFREIAQTDKQHRTPEFRVLVGRSTIVSTWDDILSAYEREYHDAEEGNFNPGSTYPAQKVVSAE